MGLTDFGKTIRKARVDIGTTLAAMAADLGVSAAFLSGLETGRKNISDEWIVKISAYFSGKGIEVPRLAEMADVSNKSVSIAGCDPQKQMLIAGFARSNLDAETLEKIAKLIGVTRE